ncbi:MAG: PQQ-binding-like beta-propeller repeat protein [Candidatus Bathyarchaeota archaeon]|nr:PQQ-binding-like beta-propeller repeat protein [Candidatus Bathyarchaeota archaeon]
MKPHLKQVLTLIGLLLILTPLFAGFLQFTAAQYVDRGQIQTFAYISAMPNPVGVGQPVIVTFRVDQPLAGATVRSGLPNGTSVTITRPDGTTETKQNLFMDSTSSGWFLYTPTQTGTYYFQMFFPQQGPYVSTVDGGGFGLPPGIYTYLASQSAKISLTVQADPIQPYDRSPPLPTGYWTRPINAENKNWWQVADNWLMRGYDKVGRSFAGTPAFAPYTSAPDSAHVLWVKPIVPGGMVGGRFGDTVYYHGISYEQFFEAMILQGTVFFTEHGLTGTAQTYGTRFMDLYTGKDYPLMYMNNTNIQFATTLNYDSPNEHGVLPYLVVSRSAGGRTYWDFYEMLPDMQQNPRLQFSVDMTGLTSGYITFGSNGEILIYNIAGSANNRYMTLFNMSRAVLGVRYAGIDVWSPSGTINASRRHNEAPNPATNEEVAYWESVTNSPFVGIEWNVSLSPISTMPNGLLSVREVNFEEGLLLATQRDSSKLPNVYMDAGYDIGSMKRGFDGRYPRTLSHLWAANRTMINDIHDRISNHIRHGKYIRYDEGQEVYYCFDMRTGQLIWKTQPLNNAWALFTRNYEIAYGKLVTSGFDGIVRCYDMNNGNILWTYDKGSAGFENAYGTYPEYAGFTIADGVVYTTADEHSSDGILWRGAQLWAIDINTGKLLWKVNGMYRHPVIADGVLIALNSYDGQVYAFGKGPSKTTVSAPQTAVPKGTAVMITGTVTDQTPALKDTPAICDDNMSAWMEYMFMQKVCPANIKGVPVHVTAIDPNGNFQDIGTVTSDAAGNFAIAWTPPVEGTYQVTATFEGSKSYGGSYSTTYFLVCPAAPVASPTVAPTVAPTVVPSVAPSPSVSPSVVPEPESAAPGVDVYVVAAAVVVVIVVVAVAAVFLRKRK